MLSFNVLFLLQLPSQRSCWRSLKIHRSCRARGASTPPSITPPRLWLAVRHKTRPTPTPSPKAPSATPSMLCQHQTKRRTRRAPAAWAVKEEVEEREETAGVQPSASSSPGLSSPVSPRSITTCTGVPPPRTTSWAGLGCSPRARAARPRPRCPTRRFSTWLCPGRLRSSWARRHRRRCTRRRWRSCYSKRRGWRTGRRKG